MNIELDRGQTAEAKISDLEKKFSGLESIIERISAESALLDLLINTDSAIDIYDLFDGEINDSGYRMGNSNMFVRVLSDRSQESLDLTVAKIDGNGFYTAPSNISYTPMATFGILKGEVFAIAYSVRNGFLANRRVSLHPEDSKIIKRIAEQLALPKSGPTLTVV